MIRRRSEAVALQNDMLASIEILKEKSDPFPPLEDSEEFVMQEVKVEEMFSDDSEIDLFTIEGFGKPNGGLALDVSRRGSGRWAHRYAARIGEKLLDQDWTGDHPTLEAALIAACDAVDDFLPKSAKGISRSDFVQARAIRRGLHEIDLAVKAASSKTIDQIRGLT